MLYIDKINYYLPDDKLLIDDYINIPTLSEKNANIFSRFYGLKRIPIAKNLTPVDLLKMVVEPIVNLDNFDRNQLKLIIHTHTIPELSVWSRSAVREVVQYFGLTHSEIFSVTMDKCVSFLRAFEIIKHRLRDDREEVKALVVSGESIFTDGHRILPSITIIGDAAGSVLVSNTGKRDQLLAVTIQKYGKYAKGHWMTSSETAEFGSLFVDLMSDIIHKTIEKANLKLSDIKVIFPHNVNIPCWRNIAKSINFPLEKIYLENIPKTSHCFNTDFMMNYCSYQSTHLLKPNDYYLVATAGTGAVFGAALFQH